ncbi:MAG: hypothetical protein NC084_09050 [Bacteroides sp.]|nr:hypothetical protein [Eubacterium sp.]MCM1419703.1 hypothetical protein [Roseburia sp.]MCM1462843.1 hypothetical protein [Bacteroides sp.]
MAEYINKLVLGNETKFDLTGDTISEDKVAAGLTFHGADGAPKVGTSTFDSDTSDATASAAELLDGKTAYVRGAKLTGTMPNREGEGGTIAEKSETFAIAQGYHDGSGKVAIDATEQAKLIPGNIKLGTEILGVTGTYTGEAITAQSKSATPAMAAQTILPDAGFDYLSQVTIGAIPVTETPNAAGGVTLKVG